VASLHKDPRNKSPNFYCAFTLSDGRRALRSTKFSDRKKAWDVCLQWEKAAEEGRKGTFHEAQSRKVLNSILESTGQGPMQSESIHDYFTHWITGKELSKKSSTAERYAIVVERFLLSLGQRAKHPLSALTVRDLEKFRNESIGKGKATKTVALEIKVIRTVLNGARRQGLILTNPAEAIELETVVSHTRHVFTPQQVQLLLTVADDEWRTAILCGYYLGARLLDVTHLKWEDVDLALGTISYVQRKTGKKVTAPLHPDLEAHFLKLAGDDPRAYLCPMLQRRGPGGRKGLSQTFACIMRKAGIDQQKIKGTGKEGRMFSQLSFHALRHTFASALANAGISAEVRQKLTGHSSKHEHSKYTHLELESLQAAISVLPHLLTNQPGAGRVKK